MKEINNEWKIEVVRCVNGYRICYYDEMEDEVMVKHEEVFQEKDTETGELECMQELLYYIKEHFGIYYSKHSKHNIVINIEENAEERGE